jgi:hypothetical protein
MTLGTMTLNIMKLSTLTLNIMKLSIMPLHTKYCYPECQVCFIVMLNVVMPCVVMLNVLLQNVMVPPYSEMGCMFVQYNTR